jgi:hypothetical protein
MHIETGHWCMDQQLYRDASNYYSRAMQVSDLVASDDSRLYELFEDKHMDRFLNQVRIASIALLEAGSKLNKFNGGDFRKTHSILLEQEEEDENDDDW